MQLILEKVGGRKEKAAKILGINRRTLYRKEREFGFIHEDTPEPAEEN
jgi:DNA-binding protein Fis